MAGNLSPSKENRFVLLVHSHRMAQHRSPVLCWEEVLLPPGTVGPCLTVADGWLTAGSAHKGRVLISDEYLPQSWAHSAALRAVSKQVLMYILGQQGITQKLLIRGVNRDDMLQLLPEVSFSHPFSYFSLLLLWNVKFDRFCFMDAFLWLLRKMSQRGLVFPVSTMACRLNSFTEKKMAEGSLVCHFGGEIRKRGDLVTARDFTSPP